MAAEHPVNTPESYLRLDNDTLRIMPLMKPAAACPCTTWRPWCAGRVFVGATMHRLAADEAIALVVLLDDHGCARLEGVRVG